MKWLSVCTVCLFMATGAANARAATIFFDDFESGSLGPAWSTASSTADGRIGVTDAQGAPAHSGTYHLAMDTTVNGPQVLNEAILSVNVAGFTSLGLSFWHKDVNDEEIRLPTSFVGSFAGDGVSFSADGTTWYRLTPELFAGPNSTYEMSAYDLTAAATAAGVTLGNSLQIKFQQYDNFQFNSDGRTFDDILVTGTPVNGTPVPEPTAVALLGAGIAAAATRRRHTQ